MRLSSQRVKYGFQALGFLILVSFQGILINLPKASANAPYLASDVLGQRNFYDSFNNGDPGGTGLHSPWDVELDSVHHRIFVADSGNHRVLVFNLDGSNNLSDRYADNVLGQDTIAESGGSDTNASGFNNNRSIAYDSTNDLLYVADSSNNRILLFNTTSITNNEPAIYVLGQADYSSATAVGCSWTADTASQSGLCDPEAITLDSQRHLLFVGDWGNRRVLVHQLDTSNMPIDQTADYVLGQPDFTSTGIDTNQKGFSGVNDMAIDLSTNYLYVSDSGNYRVLVFDTTSMANNMDASYVLGASDYTTATQDLNAKGFMQPTGLAVDSTHHLLFVGDWYNNDANRVLVFDISAITNNEDAIKVLGQADFTSNGVDTNAQGFYCPFGMTFDPNANRLYVAECNNYRVMIFDTTTINNNEDAFDMFGQTSNDGLPNYSKSCPNNSCNYIPNDKGLYGPYTATFDTNHHRLFVSDRWNYRVLVFDLNNDNELVDKVADYVIGQPDFTSNSSGASATGVGYTFGLAYDETNDRLFMSDKDNNRVLVYDVAPDEISNGMAASYVLGQADFDSVDCNRGNANPSATTLCKPFNLAIDQDQQILYVVDQNNSRVLAYDITSATMSNGKAAFRVFGQSGFTGKQCNRGGSAAANTLCQSRGLALNPPDSSTIRR